MHGHFFVTQSSSEQERARQQANLARHLQTVYKDNDYKYVVLFPEGGFATKRAIEKSNEFALRAGHEPMRRLLLPRSAATATIVRTLRQQSGESFDVCDLCALV